MGSGIAENGLFDRLKTLSAGKLFNDLCGYNKKNKLGLKNPTADEVKTWVE